MIRLAAETTPAQRAWYDLDDAYLRLHEMYAAAVGREHDQPVDSARRLQMALEVDRLWREWQAALLADSRTPGDAA